MTIDLADACTDYDLPRAPAAVLVRLDQSCGRFVLMQELRDAIDATTGNRASEESVRSAIVRVRRGIKNSGMTIETRNGVGYRLVRPPPEAA